MMRALIERFGADYEQWRALTRVGLKIDMRRGQRALSGGSTRKAGNPFTMQLIFYGAIGIVFAAMTAIIGDLMLAATLITTYAMFMVAVMVLLDYHTVVTAPDDYNILGFQPVSSRTYFAARLTNLMIFVLTVSTLIGGPSAIAFLFKAHMQPPVAAALMISVWMGSSATALAMVIVYGWLVRRVPARRLVRALSYLQLGASFLIYGGYMLLPQFLQRMGIATLHMHRTLWVQLFPPVWYASIVDVARAQIGIDVLLPLLAAVATLVLIGRAARGKISLDFAERLSAMSVGGGEVRGSVANAKPSRWFREREGRAVWILIRSQFRSDQRFRMSVLSILPLTVLYLFMAIGEGGVKDPFTAHGTGSGGLIYMAVVLFPIMLNANITRSENYRASWIFYATAADREATIVAMKNVVFISFVLPYLAFMGAILLYYYRDLTHVLVHLAMLGLISHFGLLMLMLLDPQLPFSKPIVKGERSTQLFTVTIAAGIFSALAIPLTARFVYISAVRTTVTLAALFLASLLLERLGRVRARRLIATSEFAG